MTSPPTRQRLRAGASGEDTGPKYLHHRPRQQAANSNAPYSPDRFRKGPSVTAHLSATIAILSFLFPTASALADAKDDLLAVDRAFARMSVEKGYDQAYLANLAQDGQTFTGAAPIKNKADAVRRFNDPKNPHRDPRIKITWVPDT